MFNLIISFEKVVFYKVFQTNLKLFRYIYSPAQAIFHPISRQPSDYADEDYRMSYSFNSFGYLCTLNFGVSLLG